MTLARGWRAAGERLASGWRAAGERLASGWRAAGGRAEGRDGANKSCRAHFPVCHAPSDFSSWQKSVSGKDLRAARTSFFVFSLSITDDLIAMEVELLGKRRESFGSI